MNKALSNQKRTIVSALVLSGAGLIGVALDEGYRSTAYTPVRGDVSTIGFGDTENVHPGDSTTPERALVKLGSHVSHNEAQLRKCFGNVELFQWEWDAYVRLSINVGAGAVCKSSIPEKLKAGEYKEACRAILSFSKFHSTVIRGLLNRREREYSECMGSQQ